METKTLISKTAAFLRAASARTPGLRWLILVWLVLLAAPHPGCKAPVSYGPGHSVTARAGAPRSPWQTYDAAFCDVIGTRWLQLLDQRQVPQDNGRVTLQFRLHEEGRISELQMTENNEGEVFGLICKQAVLDPAPYPRWPAEVRKHFGKTRSFRLTFAFDTWGKSYFSYGDPATGAESDTTLVLYLPEQGKQVLASRRPWAAHVPAGGFLLQKVQPGNDVPTLWYPSFPSYWDWLPARAPNPNFDRDPKFEGFRTGIPPANLPPPRSIP